MLKRSVWVDLFEINRFLSLSLRGWGYKLKKWDHIYIPGTPQKYIYKIGPSWALEPPPQKGVG